MRKWTSSTPRFRIKKQNRHFEDGRSQNTLFIGLGGSLGTHAGNHSAMEDEAPKAKWYHSDSVDTYRRLWYHQGRYEVSKDKSSAFSVEADNAELRHYLACLDRKS